MKSITSAGVHVQHHRTMSRLMGLVPAAVLLTGLLAVWAGPLAGPVAADSSGDWSQFHNGPDHTGYNSSEAILSASNLNALGLAWKAPTGGVSNNSSPSVSNGVVYIGSDDGKLYAFAVGCAIGGATCAPLWTATTGGAVHSSPAVANGVVYVGSWDKLYAFDAGGVTGCSGSPKVCTPLWTATAGGNLSYSSPVVADGFVYIGSHNTLYAFSVGCASGGGTCTPTWTATTGDNSYTGSPAVANGVVYIATGDGKLYAFATGCATGGGTCVPLWKGAFPGQANFSSPAVSGGKVFVGSYNGLYAFSVGCSSGGGTCSPLWVGPTADQAYSSPAVADGVVYVGSLDSKLYVFAVGCSSGGGSCSPLWTGTTGSSIQISSPAIANGVVYVGSDDNKLYAFAVGCGSGGAACSPLWTATTDGNVLGSPAVSNSVVYVTSDQGTLYAYGLNPLDHLVLSPSSATITAGGSQIYSATGFDGFGHSWDVTPDTAFSISGGGSCTGTSCTSTTSGDHTITGTDGSATGTATVHVNAAALDHLVISPSSASITAGGSQAYTAEGFDAYNNSLGDVTSSTVFTVDSGVSCPAHTCSPSAVGDHTVTGTDGTATGTATLHVNHAGLDHLVLSPSSATIAAGGSQGYTAVGFDAYGNSLGDVTAGTTFTVDAGSPCPSALCAPMSAGDHTVTGTDGTATGTATLHVNHSTLDHLVLSPASATITAGGSQAYIATGFDAYSNALGDLTSASTFTIGSGGSCTGSSCTSTASGDHLITGTDGSASGTATLHVNAAALDHLILSPASATITAGGSRVYTAEGFDVHGNSLGDVTSSTTFTIAGAGICTGSSCTSTAAGDHLVTGTDGSATGTATLHVNNAALDQLVLSPASATVAAGLSQAYAATGFDTYGNSFGDVTASTTFGISGVGSCTGASCTSTAAGDHTVTGTDGTATGTATLHVNHANLDHLVLSPASATVTAGASQPYTAEGFDAYGNSFGDLTAASTLTIGSGGSCIGSSCASTAAGDHLITGTDGAASGTATLHVNAGSIDHLTLSPLSATIAAGGSQAYTATGFDVYNNSLGDVTSATNFMIAGGGICTGASCASTVTGAHAITGADGDATGTATLHVTHAALEYLVLSPASATIVAGGSRAYTAEGFDSYDNSLGDVTSGTTFTIAGGSCAAASCHANSTGDHTVTGTDGTAAGTATLHVTAGLLDHLDLSPSDATIAAGSGQAYTAQGVDAYGNDLGDVTSDATFTIADGSCTGASCYANTAGGYTVTGTDGTAHGTATLHVNAGALDHLVLSPATATITAGGSQAYTATGFDIYGNSLGDVSSSTTFSVAGGSCTGSSCTSSVAGGHTVTGVDGTAHGSAILTVTPGAATHFVVSGYPTSDVAGVAHNITLTAKDPYGNTATGYVGTVHFTSSDSAAVLPANGTLSSGVGTFAVTLKTAGTKTVTATDTVTASITGLQSGIVVNPASASHFVVSGYPPSDIAGAGHTVTITALDAYGNTATGYRGTVHFTSTDPAAVMPANYTFVAGDNGVHAFSGGLTLKTAGSRSVTATDTVTASITGSQTVTVTPAAATHFSVSTANPYVAGTGHTVTVSALDAYGNVATSYRGIIHFTSSDSAAVLPADYTFVAADAGVHAFSGGLHLKTAGSRSVTATDTVTASITGSQTVTVTPAAATHFTVSTANPYVAGAGHTVTVSALDAYGNTASGYLGKIHFTSTDPAAVLPADYTFTAADKGVHAFSGGLTLKTAGSRSVTATDTVTASIAGSQTAILVNPAAATTLTVKTANPYVHGVGHSVTITALDAYGNTATGYLGTIHFTSSDTKAVLPANYTFTAADKGVHVLIVHLETVGTRTLTATDTLHATITGSQTISVT